MSGFEIVGVILGALPLVISGLEHYRDGLDTMKDMWHYESRIADLITVFDSATVRYRLTCENLLGPLMLPDKQYAELLNNPRSSDWQNGQLGKRLERRLGYSYSPYSKLVVHLQKALMQFATKMGLDTENNMKPVWMKQNGEGENKTVETFFQKSSRFWHGLKIGLDGDKLDKLLEQIEKDIFRIEKLTEKTIKLEPQRQELHRKSNTSGWQSVRDYAKSLFAALSTPWCCDCKHAHETCLKLELPTPELVHDQDIMFAILFSYGTPSNAGAPVPWDWRDVEIRLSSETSKALVKTTPPLQTHKKTKSVSWAARISGSVPVPQQATTEQQASSVPVPRIDDLCKALRKEGSKGIEPLGFIGDQVLQHHIFPATQWTCSRETWKLLSLHEVLSEANANSSPKHAYLHTISPRDKYRLALVLANTVLLVAETPWLKDRWGLSDVYFVGGKSGDDTSFAIEPYLSRKVAVNVSGAQDEVNFRNWVQNEIVFALGVVMIELSFGNVLSEYTTRSDLDNQGNEHSFTRWLTANRLVRELEHREPSKYAHAANRCIGGRFDAINPSLDNPVFQQQFYQGVIGPLQELYEFLL